MDTKPDFNSLYREHYPRVLGLCRRLLNSPALAEDATQETFMRAYNNFSRYDASQPFWQWVATIANNYCIDLLRRRTREKLIFDPGTDKDDDAAAPDYEDTRPDTVAQLITDENADMLTSAIDQLPENYRIPLVMAYYNDASYEEIAQTLDISVNHVGVLLLRAKKQLRKRVENLLSQQSDTQAERE